MLIFAVALLLGTNAFAQAQDSKAVAPLRSVLLQELRESMDLAVLFVTASVVAIAAALLLFGVRDWRCYGAAFLSPAVLTGVTYGTVTPLLLLGVSALWRWRDREWPVSLTG